MGKFIPGVEKEGLEDLVMAQLQFGPKKRHELDELLGTSTSGALTRLRKCGAIKRVGNHLSGWQATDKPYREICNHCKDTVFAWRIYDGECNSCRQTKGTASISNKSMYHEYDLAAPFNRLLRLPFGLSSDHYEACLNRN
ncbi:hypothetical protein [Vibrio sp. Sgm 5]|uniref:hypothetical protein n=1 Tax=Vibrio sp. Sgm 5 TaxID=2994387 RepID=UPI002248CE37|nr:hypothetical protein [Vibrio sp. Sgm 5]MCX2788379.1 hypothetical protein [Vibrio sp. Sgm 5]